MGRPKQNEMTASLDTTHEIRQLFGTIRNAYQHLGSFLPYERFRRGMMRLPITKEESDDITWHWHRWQVTFLAKKYRRKGHTLSMFDTETGDETDEQVGGGAAD